MNVGDRIKVLHAYGERSKKAISGQIVHIGQGFVVVQLKNYRESFWMEDIVRER